MNVKLYFRIVITKLFKLFFIRYKAKLLSDNSQILPFTIFLYCTSIVMKYNIKPKSKLI